jgi:hypothetical protein
MTAATVVTTTVAAVIVRNVLGSFSRAMIGSKQSSFNKFLTKYLQICHRRCNLLTHNDFARWQIFQKVADICHHCHYLMQKRPVFAVFGAIICFSF